MNWSFELNNTLPRLTVLCCLVFGLGLLGCGTQRPPPRRGYDAPILEGRDAAKPHERIEVLTATQEHFVATVRSVNDEGFEVDWKVPLADPSQRHRDSQRTEYRFDEVIELRTASSDLEASIAQASERVLREGSRIRIWSPKLRDNPREAEVLEVHENELLISVSGRSRSVRASFDKISRLDIVTGKSGHATEGIIVGGILGGVAAVAILSATQDSSGGLDDLESEFARGILGTVLGVAVGAALGRLIGGNMGPDVWETVITDGAFVSVQPRPQGDQFVALTIAF